MTDYSIDIIKDTSYTIELNEQGPQGIQGERGIQGPVGPVGPKGDIGPANTLTVGSVTKGEEAEVTIEGKSPNQTINFVLPKGDKGDKGDQGIQGIQGIQGEVGPVGPQGKAATITIGEVKTVDPNTLASVINVGTSTDSILDFEIPRGYKGEAATIVVGSTTTSEPGTEANVVNSGDENMAILEFTIPKGKKGDKGDTGEQGPQGVQGLIGPQGPQGLSGISVTGVEQISKVGLVATYRMYFSDDTHFDYEVTDGSVDGVTREQVVSLIGYEPASYTSVEGLTTRVSTLEDRVEDLTTALDSKQNKGNYALKSEIPTNNNQLANGAGYITSSYHDSTKQDVISDLENIRAGAAKGATAIQNTNDCVHKTGNETVAGVKTFTGNPVFSNNAFGGQLSVNRTNNSGGHSTVKFLNGGTVKGYLGIDSKGNPIYCNSSNTSYNIVRNSTIDKAVGSATKPVYINSSGVATAITSYAGNSATATKATQDGNGNNIVNTYATKTSLNAKANTSLSNLTEAGTQAIKTISQEELNNPFTFGMNQYYKGEMNNISWLKSNGQENIKSAHPDFYSWVLTNANAGKKGFKLSTASNITDYDFVVNTTKETFRLPLKNGMEGVFANTTAPVVGTGISLGLTNGTTYCGLHGSSSSSSWDIFNPDCYGSRVSTQGPSLGNSSGVIGLTTDATKSGVVADLSNVTVPQGYNLYYYVGETVQNANLIDAGRIGEQLSDKLDRSVVKAYITETYQNGSSWYRVYSDGWCEQGGYINTTTSVPTFNLLKIFRDTNYTIIACTSRSNICPTMVKSNSQFYADFGYGGSTQQGYWQASGYIA